MSSPARLGRCCISPGGVAQPPRGVASFTGERFGQDRSSHRCTSLRASVDVRSRRTVGYHVAARCTAAAAGHDSRRRLFDAPRSTCRRRCGRQPAMRYSLYPKVLYGPVIYGELEVSYGFPACYIPPDVLYSPGGVMRPPEVLCGPRTAAHHFVRLLTYAADTRM